MCGYSYSGPSSFLGIRELDGGCSPGLQLPPEARRRQLRSLRVALPARRWCPQGCVAPADPA